VQPFPYNIEYTMTSIQLFNQKLVVFGLSKMIGLLHGPLKQTDGQISCMVRTMPIYASRGKKNNLHCLTDDHVLMTDQQNLINTPLRSR